MADGPDQGGLKQNYFGLAGITIAPIIMPKIDRLGGLPGYFITWGVDDLEAL